jgi:hypothetical protein
MITCVQIIIRAIGRKGCNRLWHVADERSFLQAFSTKVFSMKTFKNILALAAAVAVVGAPVVASATPASKLSVSKSVRAGTATKKSTNDLGGGSTIIAIIAAVAVVAGIVIASSGGSKSP